jgi:putative nucleotidyltransferase with HDIG domain
VFAAINAIVSPVLTYASLIVFERFFHVTTDLTLLEFSDLNHPLLQELSHKAPGTFHHSVNLATLAESAAEAVDANPILARVGAYFHDIGKLGRPSAYVENQLTSSGKMEKMSPLTHARLIASHVKEGIELAGQKRLPDTVIDFIPMHHGTTQIGFFYTQALKRRNKTEELNPNDFRYPGPKPQTKETGIVMLADAVEAATRAIEEPTVQKIEERVDAMIKARFMEGELDECDLTLRDLSKIRSSFVKILSGIHHARLQYPEQPSISSPAPEVSEQTIAAPAGEPATNGKRTRRRIRNIDAS